MAKTGVLADTDTRILDSIISSVFDTGIGIGTTIIPVLHAVEEDNTVMTAS